MTTRAFCLALGLLTTNPNSSIPLHIGLKHDSAAEQLTRDRLQAAVTKYDLDRFTFTNAIIIEERAIPHSDPVLTLNTRYANEEERLVTSFLHEQLHWYADARSGAAHEATRDLRVKYPRVPFGNADGAADEESTYLHLIVCSLELDADRKTLGERRTAALLEFLENDHYRWVYRTIAKDHASIDAVLAAHHLSIDDALAYRQSIRTNAT